jgi:hypothetical protein
MANETRKGAFDECWPPAHPSYGGGYNPQHRNESPPEDNRTQVEMDWEEAYVQIAVLVSAHFPECEVTTVDMVRLLLHENATLRLALNLPPAKTVLRVLDRLENTNDRAT